MKIKKYFTPTEIIVDYILMQPELYQALIESHSDFYEENHRYFSVYELSQEIKETVDYNFTEYTGGDVPEHLVIKALLANTNYHRVAMQIYPKFCNDTTEYRQFGVAITPSEYYSMSAAEYEKGMQAFFENKYLNF